MSTVSNRPMTPTEWAMLVLLAAIWGGAFFFNAVAVREVPVLTVVVSRLVLAALILLAVLALRRERLPRGPIWASFFLMGLLNNAVPFVLIVWGQTHIASGVAAILNASTPLFTVLLAHALTDDERMTWARFAGVLTGFAGVAVMIGTDALETLGLHVAAQLACIAAALSYASASVFGRRFRRMGVAPLTAATGQLVAASVILLPLTLAVDRPWTLPPPGALTVGALIGVAVISTAFAYVLYYRILATAGATNLALVTFLVPVSACLLGIVFLNEVLLPRHFAGMWLIGLGLAILDGRPWQRLRRRRESLKSG